MSQDDKIHILDADQRRRLYFEDYKDRIDRRREGAAFWEGHAIDFAKGATKTLTYLNGGGLVAIPAVLFRADPRDVKIQLICAAASLIAGLVFVAIAQGGAFFVMARRSEAESEFQNQEVILLASVHYPGSAEQQAEREKQAQQSHNSANVKQK